MEGLGLNSFEAARVPVPPLRSRRRRVRHKIHTPAYASLNGNSTGQVLDLSEIVDISEEGMAIQTSSPLRVKHSVNLCLDLPATSARIHTTGEVIWADRSGRAGIRFPQMPDESVRQLKEWLFLNAMVACVNQRADQLPSVPASPAARPSVFEKPPQGAALYRWMRHDLDPAAPADYTSILAALAAVKREVELLGPDLDRALELLAQRAQTFTCATGAAIALTQGPDMICRASAGNDAPGIGARFSVGSGFSGECVRTGQLLRCEDSEVDPLVDRESCRAIGIRSMIAVPIAWDEAVIGILEIFSPEPYAFDANDPIVLKRLAGMCSFAVHRAGKPRPSELSSTEQPSRHTSTASPESARASVDDEFPVETTADLPLPHLSRFRKILLAAAAVTIAVAGSWLMTPHDSSNSSSPAPSSAVKLPPKAPAPAVAPADSVEGIRKLAEQGDPAAQFSVGARYATGDEVPQDYAEAVRWFTLAAEQGHVVAQATLGAYYWAGRGVPQDLVKAYFWSVLAQAGGDEASKYRVAVLASRMNHSQITAAQQLANDWIKEHQSVSQNAPASQ